MSPLRAARRVAAAQSRPETILLSTRQFTRGQRRQQPALRQVKARADGRLRVAARPDKSAAEPDRSQLDAIDAWRHIGSAPVKS